MDRNPGICSHHISAHLFAQLQLIGADDATSAVPDDSFVHLTVIIQLAWCPVQGTKRRTRFYPEPADMNTVGSTVNMNGIHTCGDSNLLHHERHTTRVVKKVYLKSLESYYTALIVHDVYLYARATVSVPVYAI